MSRRLRFLALFPALLPILPTSAREKPTESHTARILCLNASHGAPATAHLHDGGTSHPVDLPRMNLSTPTRCQPGR